MMKKVTDWMGTATAWATEKVAWTTEKVIDIFAPCVEQVAENILIEAAVASMVVRTAAETGQWQVVAVTLAASCIYGIAKDKGLVAVPW